MTQKRKTTYEQELALAAGRRLARSNQRRRVAARQAAEQRDQEWRDSWTHSPDRYVRLYPLFGHPFFLEVTGEDDTTLTGVVVDEKGEPTGEGERTEEQRPASWQVEYRRSLDTGHLHEMTSTMVLAPVKTA